MGADQLIGMLDRLDEMIPEEPHWTGIGLKRNDWRPVWALAKEIQQAFNAGPGFASKSERQGAWDRFNRLRDRASAVATAERDALRGRSTEHRDAILDMCSGIEYSEVSDALFFFDPTTKEQLKRWSKYLGQAMKALSDRKHEMLKEHKQQCFERIQVVKDSHDRFWAAAKEAGAARRDQYLERRSELIRSAQRNRDANRERLAKARDALGRHLAHVQELRDKVAESTSAKWRAIHESWLEEAESKVEDIEASIGRIQEWLEDDDQRLHDLNQ